MSKIQFPVCFSPATGDRVYLLVIRFKQGNDFILSVDLSIPFKFAVLTTRRKREYD